MRHVPDVPLALTAAELRPLAGLNDILKAAAVRLMEVEP